MEIFGLGAQETCNLKEKYHLLLSTFAIKIILVHAYLGVLFLSRCGQVGVNSPH